MFGYLKVYEDKKGTHYSQFKKNYCFLCKCLGEKYGLFSRFFLSFDITFFLMVITEEQYLDKINKISCSTKVPKEFYESDISDKIASMSILLTYAKIEDDILDEHKPLAFILKALLSRTVKKVKQTHQNMWKIIDQGYKEIRKLELNKGTVEKLELAFSNIICSLAKYEFNCTDSNRLSILEFTTRWIYFIDAYDDYDVDNKKGRFNPLKFNSLNERFYMFYVHMKQLTEKIRNIEVLADKNYQAVCLIMMESIKVTNYSILKKKRLLQ